MYTSICISLYCIPDLYADVCSMLDRDCRHQNSEQGGQLHLYYPVIN